MSSEDECPAVGSNEVVVMQMAVDELRSMFAVLNAGSSTPVLVKRRAPPADAPLTHFAPPLHPATW